MYSRRRSLARFLMFFVLVGQFVVADLMRAGGPKIITKPPGAREVTYFNPYRDADLSGHYGNYLKSFWNSRSIEEVNEIKEQIDWEILQKKRENWRFNSIDREVYRFAAKLVEPVIWVNCIIATFFGLGRLSILSVGVVSGLAATMALSMIRMTWGLGDFLVSGAYHGFAGFVIAGLFCIGILLRQYIRNPETFPLRDEVNSSINVTKDLGNKASVLGVGAMKYGSEAVSNIATKLEDKAQQSASEKTDGKTAADSGKAISERLDVLDQLRANGHINAEEYDAKKNEIIREI
jgi:hypothetical protein